MLHIITCKQNYILHYVYGENKYNALQEA